MKLSSNHNTGCLQSEKMMRRHVRHKRTVTVTRLWYLETMKSVKCCEKYQVQRRYSSVPIVILLTVIWISKYVGHPHIFE